MSIAVPHTAFTVQPSNYPGTHQKLQHSLCSTHVDQLVVNELIKYDAILVSYGANHQ